MAYALGAILPLLLMLIGAALVVVGLVQVPPRDGLAIAGSILLVGGLLAYALADVSHHRGRRGRDE